MGKGHTITLLESKQTVITGNDEITLRGFKLIRNYSEYMSSDNVSQVCERFSYLLKLTSLLFLTS